MASKNARPVPTDRLEGVRSRIRRQRFADGGPAAAAFAASILTAPRARRPGTAPAVAAARAAVPGTASPKLFLPCLSGSLLPHVLGHKCAGTVDFLPTRPSSPRRTGATSLTRGCRSPAATWLSAQAARWLLVRPVQAGDAERDNVMGDATTRLDGRLAGELDMRSAQRPASSCPPGRAMPRLSGRSRRGCFPFLQRCLAAVPRREAPVPDASPGARRGAAGRHGALAGRVPRASALVFCASLAAALLGTGGSAEAQEVLIDYLGSGDRHPGAFGDHRAIALTPSRCSRPARTPPATR